MNWRVAAVFVLALAVRAAVLLVVAEQPEAILQPDSRIYLALSENLQKDGSFFPQGRSTPAYLVRVPGYPLFLAFVSYFWGKELLGIVLIQIALDAFVCVLILNLSEMLIKGTGLIAGCLAAMDMGMISYSHFILNDGLFLLPVLLLMIIVCKQLHNYQPGWSALAGATLGLATLIRPIAMFLPLLVVPLFGTYSLVKLKLRAWTTLVFGSTMLAAFFVILAPWILYIYGHYERFGLSAQAGEHLLQYVVPSVWEQSKGVSFSEGLKRANLLFEKKAAEEGLDLKNANPFEVSEFQASMAVDYLRSEPKVAILKAWIFGAAKNLFSPALIDLSYLLHVQRPHFFRTEGTTALERGVNFVRGMKGWFGYVLIANLVFLGMARVIQLWGLMRLIRTKPWEALFFTLIVVYFLVISGPVGYAKYRLPFEPILIVLLAIGLKDLWERWKRRSWRSEV